MQRLDGEELRLAASSDPAGAALAPKRPHRGRPARSHPTLRAIVERAAVHVPDVLADPDCSRELARAAYQRFGKGSGHPAQLNLGDCAAYASRSLNLPLLLKGDDSIHNGREPGALSRHAMVGILNSAPARMPVGQRVVTAFCLV